MLQPTQNATKTIELQNGKPRFFYNYMTTFGFGGRKPISYANKQEEFNFGTKTALKRSLIVLKTNIK